MNEFFPIEDLETKLLRYKPMMVAAVDTILDQEVSQYPILIIYQETTVDIGILLSDRSQTSGEWSVNASTLEEFVARQVITPDKVDDFKRVYKDPETYICIFVLSEIGATFVFIPRN